MLPEQKPGRSRQDYGTPRDFLDAVRRRLGIAAFSVDLAATAQNTVADQWLADAFAVDWSLRGWCWCNPPFGKIEPWVRKAYQDSTRFGSHIAMLTPASVGSDWWCAYVHGKACVWFLNGRLTFLPTTDPYPKDCGLLLYSPQYPPGYDVWTWRRVRPNAPRLMLDPITPNGVTVNY